MRQSGKPILIAWWGSLATGGPTIGDRFAVEALSQFLFSCGYENRILMPEGITYGFPNAVDDMCPHETSAFVWACGPLIYASKYFSALVDKYRDVPRAAIGVSIVDRAEKFDLILARDGLPDRYFDIALAKEFAHRKPRQNQSRTLALCFRGQQREYGVENCENDRARKLAGFLEKAYSPTQTIDIETRIDRIGGTIEEILDGFQNADFIITTRLHGALLALEYGIPFIAIDQISEGKKLSANLKYLRIPSIYSMDDLEEEDYLRVVQDALSTKSMVRFTESRLFAKAGANFTLVQLSRWLDGIVERK